MKQDRRTFNLYRIEEGSKKSGVFRGISPRQAALKAAKRGAQLFALRESDTRKLHIFQGWTEIVPRSDGQPKWLCKTMNIGKVRKLGVVHVKSLTDIPDNLVSLVDDLVERGPS
jgi:hypothetical protein